LTVEERVQAAIELAVRFGGIDGEHHKTWVIDQMVRALTGGRKRGDSFSTSREYRKLIKEACAGEAGPDSYSWDEGIAP
jgi:hypothetical protein